jgi:hypothetical protein
MAREGAPYSVRIMSSDKEQRPPTKNPAVISKPPPAALMRLVNPLMRVIIRSRFGRRLEPLAVLRVTGRRTGIRREFVAGVHMVDGIATVFTGRPWRLNFQGGTNVVVMSGGAERQAHAMLVEEPSEVGRAFAIAVRQAGARNLGVAIVKGADPTPADFAAVGRSMIRITYV